MSNVINKEQCPDCAKENRDSAGDNLVTFDSGVKYCVACAESKGRASQGDSQPRDVETTEKLSGGMIQGEDPQSAIRGISPKTMRFYGYQINKEKQVHIANYYDESGKVVMQQLRGKDKSFPLLGNRNHKGDLYGAWKFTPDERVFITITEGQIDALSIAEVFDCKYPVVSLPLGAGSAAASISDNSKYLSGFKYVVLAFDNDKPGQDATETCLKLFEPGKVRVAKLPRKDANDMLIAGEGSELRQCIYGSVEYQPDPILTGDEWLDTLKGYKRTTRPWPWAAADRTIQPMSIPGIYSIAAAPGVGKTLVVSDIIKSAIQHSGKCGVISLEESSQNLLLKLTDMLVGSDLSSITNRELTNEEIESCREATKNIVTYDHKKYGSSLETIIENLPYIAQSLKCDTVVFDNLSYSATNEKDDERRALDRSMIALKDSTTKYNYLLINVCHTNSDNDDYKSTTIRGSRGIMMYSDMVIHLGRETESEDIKERNTLNFYVKKDRLRGIDTGKSFQLHYDPRKRRFVDVY